jgi:hypothetical protein
VLVLARIGTTMLRDPEHMKQCDGCAPQAQVAASIGILLGDHEERRRANCRKTGGI